MRSSLQHSGDEAGEAVTQAAAQVAQLMRQRRREAIHSRQLIARLGRILDRRCEQHGLTGLLGGDLVREITGIRRPRPLPVTEPVSRPPMPPPTPEPPPEAPEAAAEEIAEATEIGAVVEARQHEEQAVGLEAPQATQTEAPTEEAQEEGAAPEPEPAPVSEDLDAGIVSDIRAAAAEAAAVEELAEAAPLAEEGVREPARETVRPSRAPLRTEADGETPFEFVIEPRALVPGRIEFVRSSDEVLFNRAIDSLGSRDARGMREGLQMLGRIPGETAAAVLRNLYSIAPARWRSEVAHQLVNHAAPGIKEFFREVLDRHDEPAVVRVAALRALYARDKALATEYLLKALGDESDDVRAAAATYVGWLREKRAMPLLEQLVGDRSSVVATAALRAAASIRL